VPHREDLHQRSYQYANDFLSREEARRIAEAISRLPELLKRPRYLDVDSFWPITSWTWTAGGLFTQPERTSFAEPEFFAF
jgi:hypothetical protein